MKTIALLKCGYISFKYLLILTASNFRLEKKQGGKNQPLIIFNHVSSVLASCLYLACQSRQVVSTDYFDFTRRLVILCRQK